MLGFIQKDTGQGHHHLALQNVIRRGLVEVVEAISDAGKVSIVESQSSVVNARVLLCFVPCFS